MTSSRDIAQARRAEVAEQAFAKQQHVRALVDNERDTVAAKTAKLRELRLAKESADREAAKPSIERCK